jgi:hypothetical protein
MIITSDATLARCLPKPAADAEIHSNQATIPSEHGLHADQANPKAKSTHSDDSDLSSNESHGMTHLNHFPAGPGWKEHPVKPADTLQVAIRSQ